MSHEVLAECEQIFKRLEEKLDDLRDRDEKRNCRYDKHCADSDIYREKILRHDEILKDIVNLKRWWLTAAFAIVGAIVSMAVIWGGYAAKVDRLERVHEGRQGVQGIQGPQGERG
jgi:hypothetical protein